MTIDALALSKRLEKDFTREQAEAIASGVRDLVTPQLATKADVDAAVLRLENRLTGLDGKLTLVHWMIGFNLVLTAGLLWKALAG